MIAVTHRSRAAPRDEPRLNPRSKGYKAAVGSLAPGQPLTDSPPPAASAGARRAACRVRVAATIPRRARRRRSRAGSPGECCSAERGFPHRHRRWRRRIEERRLWTIVKWQTFGVLGPAALFGRLQFAAVGEDALPGALGDPVRSNQGPRRRVPLSAWGWAGPLGKGSVQRFGLKSGFPAGIWAPTVFRQERR